MEGFQTNNTINYLRNRNNISRKQLAQETGLTIMDISRMERNNKSCGLDKYRKVAEYFNLTVGLILNNDITAVISYIMKNKELLSASNELQIAKHKSRINIGNYGEAIALEYEILRHIESDSPYLQYIDPSAAQKPKNGCDIFSRTLDGRTLLIEVKTSRGGLKSKFFITRTEVNRAKLAEKSGEEYLVYRVIYVNDDIKRDVIVLTLAEIQKQYLRTPESYSLKLRKGVALC